MRRFLCLLSLACLLAVPVVEKDAQACTNAEEEAAITVDKTSATHTIANEKNKADANLDRAMAAAANEALTCKKAIATNCCQNGQLVAITTPINSNALITANIENAVESKEAAFAVNGLGGAAVGPMPANAIALV